jgi:DNA-binding MarR family transcriptional regulator
MLAESMPRSEDCNCFAVRSAARHVSQFYDQFLAPIGLRTTQFSILARLKRLGPQSINALAESMVMDRTTLGRNIRPLQRDGLIRIEPAASDRRIKELNLSAAGEQRLEAAMAGWSAAQAQFESAFGPRRAADLRAMLHAVVANELTAADRPAGRAADSPGGHLGANPGNLQAG